MARFAVKTLEFDKVKALLASKTATSLGKAQALAIRTESEFSIVKRLQEETAEALRLLDEGKRFPFGGAHNIVAAVKHAQLGAVLEAETLMEIGSTAAAIRQIKTFLQEESELAPTLAAYAEALQPLPRLEKQLENAISEKGEIKDSASTKLGGLRTGIQMAKNRVREQLEKVLHDPNNQKYFQDALVTMRGDRYVIPIKQEYKLNFPGVVHDQSGSGATLFIEPMAVVNLNNDIKKYMAEEKEEIERILRQLSGSVGADGDLLTAGVETLTNLDVICARAYLAQAQKAVRPMLHLGGKVEIVQGRHPLLDQSQVVPLDIELGGGFNTLLITGPNTGGKTVALKAVGLFALMAQAGLFLPARSAKMPVFRAIYADIGDEQSIEQSLSTFSAHMTSIVDILGKADSHSLCLFDELGAGTDPTEGAALAIAVLNFLHNMKCRTMATTHYSELKVYALSTPGVENACCEFDVQTLRPTYRLLIGVPGKSNAFAIASRLGLPDYIIEDAKSHIETEDETFEDVISRLEESRVTIEKEREEIQSYKAEIASLKSRLEQKEERFDERKDKMIRSANEEAQRILRQAKETADRTIKNINKLAASSGVDTRALEAERTKIRENLKKVDSKLSLKQESKPHKAINPKTLRLGDSVRVLSMNLKGTISSLPDAQGNLFVQMGILRSKVNLSDLELIQENSISAPGLDTRRKGSGSSSIKMSKSSTVSMEINLLGKTVDEAIPELDKYLDDAYIAHLPQVRVVHGKGTGALRAGIHRHLKKLKYVKEFHLGGFGEGDAGVTIVVFK